MSSARPEYNTLGHYNSFGSPNAPSIHPPLRAGVPSMAIEVVPVYGMPGYEALTHDDQLNGSGYFGIGSAYPAYAGNCDKFQHRPCAGRLAPERPPISNSMYRGQGDRRYDMRYAQPDFSPLGDLDWM